MKKIILIILITSLPMFVWAREESWSFVQSVGGLIIEAPIKSAKGWTLPVRVDVSGLQTISVKPTTLNSALVCKHISVMIVEYKIYLTVVSGLPDPKSDAMPACAPAMLGEIIPGKYTIFYRTLGETPVQLGEVNIEIFK